MEGNTGNYSFQNMLKVMNALAEFEKLLDVTELNSELCIELGVHEQFKQLLGKVGKCVKQEDVSGKIFCVCKLCSQEVKIVSFDVRTSLAIHCASDEHRCLIKKRELENKDYQNKPGSNIAVGFDANLIPDELKKSDTSMPTQNEQRYVKNNLSSVNNASGVGCKCQMVLGFCTCGVTKNAIADLGDKLTNLNLQMQSGSHSFAPPPKLETLKFFQQPPPKGNQPTPQNNRNRGQAGRGGRSRSECGTRQSINIHVHVPGSSDQPTAAQPTSAQPPVAKEIKKSSFEENLEKLRTRQLEPRAEVQLMFKMVREAEGSLWKRNHISKDGNEYQCNVCDTGASMNSPYDVVMHTKGKFHRNKLTTRTDNRQDAGADKQCEGVVSYINPHNLSLLRKRLLDEDEELSLMWEIVREAEGERWNRDHIYHNSRDNSFCCNLCAVRLNSPYQVVQHVQGQTHSEKVDAHSKEDCIVM